MIVVVVASLVGLATSATLTPVARAFAVRRNYLDVPNERSSHQRPTPRTGGFAIVAGLLAGTLASGSWRDQAVAAVLGATVALTALATRDERRALPRALRLVFQVAIAAWCMAALRWDRAALLSVGGIALPLWVAVSLSVIWIVGVINTYNFMDGLNGIASVVAIVCGLTFAFLASGRGDVAGAAMAAATAGAAAGFLPFNFPSGSVFMGDTGSTTLGVALGALALRLTFDGVPPVAAALPLAPFLLDAGVTIVRRAVRRERFFSTPHRSHFYQRLQQHGWSHASVTALYGGLAASSAAVALAYNGLGSQSGAAAVLLILLLHAVIFGAIEASSGRQATSGVGAARTTARP